MEKPWLESYPPGVAPTIDPDRHASLVALCDAACREFSTRPAFANLGARLGYAELDRHATAFAAWLQQRCGIARGERVALIMPNMLAYPVALLGALRAGAVVVNTNPQYTPRELAAQLADSGARVAVVFEPALAALTAAQAETGVEHVVVTRLGDLMPRVRGWLVNRAVRKRAGVSRRLPAGATVFHEALDAGTRLRLDAPALTHDDLAFLQYTGGTTGRAKGAMLTHGNLVANVLQVTAWFGDAAVRGEEIVITALPLYHIYALTANCFAFISQGGLNYLITDPRDIARFVRELRRVPFTTMTGVNTLFNALLAHPDFARLDFSTLKFTSGGGMAVQRAVAERWQAVTGCTLAEGYGLTEASPVVTINRFDVSTYTASIGLPVPSTDCRIVDELGAVLGPGSAGELCVRGPQVMRGYWNAPEETRAVLDADGWLHTGDIAVMERNGYFRLVDRKKDLILVSGFNVYPNEVEDVAASHPGVHEVAAIAAPDDRSGEVVHLVVVRADPALDADSLIAYCRERLAAYKVPRQVRFVDELPKSTVGKILRREVRARYGT